MSNSFDSLKGILPTELVDALEDTTSEPGGGGSTNSLVYRESSPLSGPTVFGTFEGLYAKIVELRSTAGDALKVTVTVDSTANVGHPTYSEAPAGTYDVHGVHWVGVGAGDTLKWLDGTTVTGLRSWESLNMWNLNTTTPLETLPAGSFERVLLVRDSILQTDDAGAAFYDLSGAVGLAVELDRSVIADNEQGPCFECGTTGALQFYVHGANIVKFPLRGGPIFGSGTASLVVFSDTARPYPRLYPNFTGSVFAPFMENTAAMRANPFNAAASTSSVTAALGDALRLDSTSGTIAQTLPAIDGATEELSFAGSLLVVKNLGTANVVNLSPAGTDTIDGGAGPFVVGSGTSVGDSVILMSDGVGNWDVISYYTAP